MACEYRIAEANSADGLVVAVNTRIKDFGYEPLGAPFKLSGVWYQAMVLRD